MSEKNNYYNPMGQLDKDDTPETDPYKGRWATYWHNGVTIYERAEQLERERNQARQEREILYNALEIAVGYIRETLADYDCSFNRHPATESGRKAISDDLEKCTSTLEKLKAKGGSDE